MDAAVMFSAAAMYVSGMVLCFAYLEARGAGPGDRGFWPLVFAWPLVSLAYLARARWRR